jgi:hypothetical protein
LSIVAGLSLFVAEPSLLFIVDSSAHGSFVLGSSLEQDDSVIKKVNNKNEIFKYLFIIQLLLGFIILLSIFLYNLFNKLKKQGNKGNFVV